MIIRTIRRPFRGPSKQRGIIIATPIFSAAIDSGFVVLTGYDSFQTNLGSLCDAGIAFTDNGQIDDVGPSSGSRTQVKFGEWWSEEPSVNIGIDYDIRCASLVTGSWTSQAASVGTYIQISAERKWSVRVSAMQAPGNKQCRGFFEIRPTGGGSVLDSANHSGDASN